MCDPVTAGAVALQGIQTFTQVDNQNEASAQNRANAIGAQNDEIASSTEQYLEQNRSLIQGGFDAILEGREAESVAYASAIENGVQGASIKALLRDKRQKTNRNSQRTQSEIKSLRRRTDLNYKNITSRTTDRINSVAPTSLNIGDAASILSPIVKAQME